MQIGQRWFRCVSLLILGLGVFSCKVKDDSNVKSEQDYSSFSYDFSKINYNTTGLDEEAKKVEYSGAEAGDTLGISGRLKSDLKEAISDVMMVFPLFQEEEIKQIAKDYLEQLEIVISGGSPSQYYGRVAGGVGIGESTGHSTGGSDKSFEVSKIEGNEVAGNWSYKFTELSYDLVYKFYELNNETNDKKVHRITVDGFDWIRTEINGGGNLDLSLKGFIDSLGEKAPKFLSKIFPKIYAELRLNGSVNSYKAVSSMQAPFFDFGYQDKFGSKRTIRINPLKVKLLEGVKSMCYDIASRHGHDKQTYEGSLCKSLIPAVEFNDEKIMSSLKQIKISNCSKKGLGSSFYSYVPSDYVDFVKSLGKISVFKGSEEEWIEERKNREGFFKSRTDKWGWTNGEVVRAEFKELSDKCVGEFAPYEKCVRFYVTKALTPEQMKTCNDDYIISPYSQEQLNQ